MWGHFGWFSKVKRTFWGLRFGFKVDINSEGANCEGLGVLRTRGKHCVYESPHKVWTKRNMCVCYCRCSKVRARVKFQCGSIPSARGSSSLVLSIICWYLIFISESSDQSFPPICVGPSGNNASKQPPTLVSEKAGGHLYQDTSGRWTFHPCNEFP